MFQRFRRRTRPAVGSVERSIFADLTDRARRVLVLAQEEARLLNHTFIGTEHILLGLLHEGDGVAAESLESLGFSLYAVRDKVEETIGPAGSSTMESPPFTPRAKKVLDLSRHEARQLGHDKIGTEHLLLGLIREGEGVATQVLVSLGGDLSQVRLRVMQTLSGYQPAPDGTSARVSQKAKAELSDRLQRRRDRLEVIEGLLRAVEHWPEVSERIFASEDPAEARETLSRPPLSLSEIQGAHVLDMRAAQRTVLGREQLLEERDHVMREIDELTHRDM